MPVLSWLWHSCTKLWGLHVWFFKQIPAVKCQGEVFGVNNKGECEQPPTSSVLCLYFWELDFACPAKGGGGVWECVSLQSFPTWNDSPGCKIPALGVQPDFNCLEQPGLGSRCGVPAGTVLPCGSRACSPCLGQSLGHAMST